MSNPDVAAKMEKVKQLSAALHLLRAKVKRDIPDALAIRDLTNQRAELRGLLPPLRIVGGTDAR